MKTLSPQQSKLLAISTPNLIVHKDFSVSVYGTLVSGNKYRTAASLERLGLGTLVSRGKSMGFFTANFSDPYPWRVEVIDRDDHELIAMRDGERIADPLWQTFWDSEHERLVFDPRPGVG